MKYPQIVGAILATLALGAVSAAASLRTAAVITIWRIPAPQSSEKSVQAIEAGVVGINFLAPQLAALSRHPDAKITLGIDPAFVAALEAAASGQSALSELAGGKFSASDPRAVELLDVISSYVVPGSELATTNVAKRFASDSAAARMLLTGASAARFSHSDVVDFATSGVLLSLLSSGYARDQAALLKKDKLNERDAQVIAQTFARAARDVLERTRKASASATVELAVLPAYEPIMPLVIDAAGRAHNAPNTVALNGADDVGYAVDESRRAVSALDPAHPDTGVLSPAGAYDDETASLLQTQHAAYAIFSERVVKSSAGASAQSVADTQAAPFLAYLLETSKTNKMPVLFCNDVASAVIESQPASAPPSAMGDQLAQAVTNALGLSSGAGSPVVVFCMSATGNVLRRADRNQTIDHLSAVLARGGAIRASTPRAFLAERPPTAQTYGYEPGSDTGGFDLWMGSAKQAVLWSALADARKAAEAGGSLERTKVREAILQAESGRWFMALALPQPRYLTERMLARFRSLIAEIYRESGKPVPPNIAPIKLEAPVAVSPTGG